jgi:ABC-type antimicrobial peptide transport system permease subunit
MLKNYTLVALRNLLKNKPYVIINVLGLGISLACCITAYILLAYNIEFNNFHADQKVSKIFRLQTLSNEKDGRLIRDEQAPIILAPIAADEIAGIGRYTRFLFGGGSVRYGDNAFNEGIAFADSTFFDLFDFPIVTGSAKSFKEKNSIFLSEELAKKYFGDEDPVGKLMVTNFVNQKQIEVIVGGVVGKVALNNTFNFRALMRMENFMDINEIKIDDWSDWRNPSTFVELESPDQEHADAIAAQFKKYIPTRNEVRTDMVVTAYALEPFKSDFSQDDIRYNWVTQRISMVPLLVFTSMAILILLIACFNLTNTSIAMTAKRLKEVGVRRAVGAGGWQIAIQFLLETTLTIAFALIAGLIMAQFIVPAFTSMWQLPYGLEDLNSVNLFVTLVVLLFTAALLAGMYPALFSSKFKPTLLLKGDVKVKGTNGLTRTLVAAQFALSVIVLIAGVVFIQNSRYQERIKFGYDKDSIITVSLQGERDFDAMEKAIASNPKIMSVGVSDGNIGSNTYQTPVRIDTGSYDVQALGVGKNYFETMGLKLELGRTFNLNNASDQEEGVIVNKAFVAKTGLVSPLEKIVILHDVRRRILGVVDNHVDNLYRSKEYEPFIFYPAGKNQYITLLVKTDQDYLPEAQKYLEQTWKEIFPTRPFESQFQEDLVLRGSRETNANLEKIFLFITVLGGLLSASGIFALASLNITKRTKEIGIRKALGATVGSIVGLLNKEFVFVLMAAVIIGSVGGYFLTNALLAEIYAYHIAVGMVTVICCALLIFAVGIFTTSTTILQAAKANPVETLRTD